MEYLHFLKEIINLKIKHYNGFLAENERIISDYNNENKTANDYQDRQILELLQNAEDANATEVKISLDKNQRKLVISNNGEQFSSRGIGSLMISDNSPKPKWENIGNKGLGFRSVITWCDKVIIKSSGCKITFTRDVADSFFKSTICSDLVSTDTDSESDLLTLNEKVNKAGLGWDEKQIKEYNEIHHKGEIICFPLFGMPIIDVLDTPSEWTHIELFYKDNEIIESQIEEQLSNKRLNEENLLFLNNIKKIDIDGDIEAKKIVKTPVPSSTKIISDFQYEEMKINDDIWKVLKDEGPYEHVFEDIPEGKVLNYSTMIAWKNDNPREEYPLYCYFPTDITVPLPFIIHGTFELNSSRKQLVNEIDFDNNSYIFSKIGKLVETAIEIIKEETPISSWNAYNFIENSSFDKDNKDNLKCLSDILNNIKNTKKIYPSVYLNLYLSKSNYIYYTETFSLFVEENFPEDFKYVVKHGKEVDIQEYQEKYQDNSKKGIAEIIPSVNKRIKTIETRAKFIGILSELNKIVPNWNYGNQFDLLLNEDGNIITKGKTGYIHKKEIQKQIQLPYYVKFDLVNTELTKLLYDNVDYSEALLKEPKREDRALKNTLGNFIKISEYDLARITDEIIKQVKDALDAGEDNAKVINAETRFLFFEYYKTKDEDRIDTASSRYKPLFFNINKDIKEASELYFSKEFGEIGKEIHDIWGNCISDDELLLFGPENGISLNSVEEINDAIKFFKFFGVNTFLTIKELQINEGKFDQYTSKNIIKDFQTFIGPRFKRINSTTKSEFSYISNVEKLITINDLTKILIILLKSEDVLKKKICNEIPDYLKYDTLTPTYINFQLRNLHKFDNAFAQKSTGILFKLLNKNPIDIERIKNETTKTYGEIFQIMQNLGCKIELYQYGINYLYDFMNTFGNLDELREGKNVSTLYIDIVKALATFSESEIKNALNNHTMNYWVINNGEKHFINAKENNIYYFDNKELPDHYLRNMNLICIPFRKGGKKVPFTLGIKGKQDWKIEILDDNIKRNEVLDLLFQQRLFVLKPIILKYRFNSEMSEETKEDTANKLNNFNVVLVKELRYSINDEIDSLSDFEFIQIGKIFYIKTPNENNVDELCKQNLFLDSFAEMLSICFELNDDVLLDSFKVLASYSEKELQQKLETDLGLASEVEEYRKYFDISQTPEYKFWKTVLDLLGDSIDTFNFTTVNELNESIMRHLGINMVCPNLYLLNKEEHIVLLKQIQNKTSIDIKEFLCKLGKNIESYNILKLENEVKIYEKQFLFKMWLKLVKSKQLQYKFIDYRDKYLNLLFKNLISEKLKYDLNFNAEQELIKIIDSDSDFDLNLDPSLENERIPLVRIRRFYKQFEPYVNQPKNDYRFYFSGYKDELMKLQTSESENNKQDLDSDDFIFDTEWGRAEEKEFTASGQKRSGHGGSHSKRVEDAKTKKGTKAEKAIIQWFNNNKELYGYNDKRGASDSAGGHDSHHVDFEYWKKDNEKDVRYLEVKASEDGTFYMSSDEFDFGNDEKNIEKYDVVLVSFDPTNPKKAKLKFIERFFLETKINKKVSEYEIAINFVKTK